MRGKYYDLSRIHRRVFLDSFGGGAGMYGSYSKGPVVKGIIDDNCMGFDIDICPDLLLAGLAAAAAGFFGVLFTAITMAGRKKKRSLDDFSPVSAGQKFDDLFSIGSVFSLYFRSRSIFGMSCVLEWQLKNHVYIFLQKKMNGRV